MDQARFVPQLNLLDVRQALPHNIVVFSQMASRPGLHIRACIGGIY